MQDAPVWMASMTATASTAPAAPSRWPIMPFVELMRSCGPGMAARMALHCRARNKHLTKSSVRQHKPTA